jgi:cation transport protein ChaC
MSPGALPLPQCPGPTTFTSDQLVGSLAPASQQVLHESSQEISAIVFVAVPAHPFYEDDASVDTVAPIVSVAAGPLGTNAEYLFKLKQALARYNMADGYVDALASKVKRIAQGLGHQASTERAPRAKPGTSGDSAN